MKKEQIIREIASKTGKPISMIEEIYKAMEEIIVDAVINKDEVAISPKIGTFVKKVRDERMVTHIQDSINKVENKRKIHLPEREVATFRISKTIKDKIKEMQE